MKFISVIPFLPFNSGFEYETELDVASGDVVFMQFGRQKVLGCVIAISDAKQTTHVLSRIDTIVARGVFSEKMLAFLAKAAAYNASDLGLFAKISFPFSEKFSSIFCLEEEFLFLSESANIDSSKSEKWHDIYRTLLKNGSIAASCMKGCSPFIKRGLILNGVREKPNPQVNHHVVLNAELPPLSEAQNDILNNILDKSDGFAVHLLDGATGSGKTEIYYHFLQNIVKKNQSAQVLLMLPEIGLARNIAARTNERFEHSFPLWHSGALETSRRDSFLKIYTGAEDIVIGTRSSLFLPYKNLKAIIVDEEHDSSYKQEEMPIYNARDMAILLAQQLDIPIILGSATPSIESVVNTQSGRYLHHILPTRFSKVLMPEVFVIYKEKMSRMLSDETLEKIRLYYASGKQSLIFINRRGYAPVVFCLNCKIEIECPDCDSYMTFHKNGMLKCHKCNLTHIASCPTCNNSETLKFIGNGCERVAEYILEMIPEISQDELAILSSDMTESKLQSNFAQISSGKVKIIVGTQMISKGYNFPLLQFVCIMDVIPLYVNADYKSNEKLFQVFTQVAGRSGRGTERGYVILETRNKSEVITHIANHNNNAFYDMEIAERKKYDLPPFSKFIAIVLKGKNANEILNLARAIIKPLVNVTILGPAPALISKIAGKLRYRILIISPQSHAGKTKGHIKNIIDLTKSPASAKIDVDPNSFF